MRGILFADVLNGAKREGLYMAIVVAAASSIAGVFARSSDITGWLAWLAVTNIATKLWNCLREREYYMCNQPN